MNMNFNMTGIGLNVPVQPAGRVLNNEPIKQSAAAAQSTFQQVFQQELSRSGSLHFSHHASQRIQERGMNMSAELMSKMSNAVDQAAAKGSKQSLLLVQNAAYIVNVPSRTVITALDNPFKQGHVFTAIDSTVCID